MRRIISVLATGALGAAAALACGPNISTGDCLEADPDIKIPSRLWCEDTPTAPDWQGHTPNVTPVCFAPLEDGTCDLCPSEEIEQRVLDELASRVPSFDEFCDVAHLEFGLRLADRARGDDRRRRLLLFSGRVLLRARVAGAKS